MSTMVDSTRTASPRSGRSDRLPLLAGAGFVVCALAGNSLTESATGSGTLGALAAQADSSAARVGLGLELLGFVLLTVFAGVLVHRLRAVPSAAASVLAVAAAVMIAVKLASGADLLGALHQHAELDAVTAHALVSANDAAFVLFWLPYGVFLAAAATALAAAGLVGAALRWSGTVLGTLTVAFGALGSVEPELAVPIPFLLGLLWLAALSLRLAVGTRLPARG